MFHLFDSVLLLSRGGYTVYCGRVPEMVAYFSTLGYPCPSGGNPADFCVAISSIHPRPKVEWTGGEKAEEGDDEYSLALK